MARTDRHDDRPLEPGRNREEDEGVHAFEREVASRYARALAEGAAG